MFRSLRTVSPSPARCLSATASPASARFPSTSASPAATRVPSLEGRGLATPSFLPHRAGPFWVGSGVNGGAVLSPLPPGQGQTSSANHPSGSPTCGKSPPPAAGKLDLWIGVVLLADKKREAEIPGGPR